MRKILQICILAAVLLSGYTTVLAAEIPQSEAIILNETDELTETLEESTVPEQIEVNGKEESASDTESIPEMILENVEEIPDEARLEEAKQEPAGPTSEGEASSDNIELFEEITSDEEIESEVASVSDDDFDQETTDIQVEEEEWTEDKKEEQSASVDE